MPSSAYKTAVLGCGRIGTDFDRPGSPHVLTHAHAYSRHRNTRLVGVMDANPERAREAASRWSCGAFQDARTLLERHSPDIVSICLPDEYHDEYLRLCMAYSPRAVVAEKPLTVSVGTSRKIVEAYREAGISLFVNYSRRFDPVTQQVRENIRAGHFGKVIHASMKYTKGILHNGTHTLDISRFLFGEYLSGAPVHAVTDYKEEDPTLSAVLHYEKCPLLFLAGCDERAYSLFEIDIVAERCRVLFDRFGFRYREFSIRDDPVFAGYHDLAEGRPRRTGLDGALLKLVQNVVDNLDRGEAILCSGEDALRAQEICQSLLDRYRRGIR